MRFLLQYSLLGVTGLLFVCCSGSSATDQVIQPLYVTDPVKYDSDDPAIWLNKKDLSQSLIVGTDKVNGDGGLYVFTIQGKMLPEKTVRPLDRPNNVDIAYGFVSGSDTIDIAVCTVRGSSQIRVFQLPDMTPIDDGGIPVFEGETLQDPMGIALYTRPFDGSIFAIVSRKTNPTPDKECLWQYKVTGTEGKAKGSLVRKFGRSTGEEIEAIAVDNEMGYVYYSDETKGIRKYYANPELQNNEELAFFGTSGFTEDHEGISIYKNGPMKGYVVVSDQAANKFHVFPREGVDGDPHTHPLLSVLSLGTESSDGSDVTNLPLSKEFPEGMFVAMSDDRTFQIYSWEAMMRGQLE